MPELRRYFYRPSRERLPPLRREMAAEYLDAFLADGSLRLSSFETFRKHPNEQRRDVQEGLYAVQLAAPNGGTTSILGSIGQQAYVISASLSTAPLSAATPALLIIDGLRFADAVARQIPEYLEGADGLCDYNDEMLSRQDARPLIPPSDGEDLQRWWAEANRRTFEHIVPAIFRKVKRFEEEQEYRFLWLARGEPRPFLSIKCPAALEFCRSASPSPHQR